MSDPQPRPGVSDPGRYETVGSWADVAAVVVLALVVVLVVLLS